MAIAEKDTGAQEAKTSNGSFRDSISTVDKKGKRVWIYPKKPSGRLHTARVYFSVLLLLVLFGLPFVKINGQPFVLLNFLERKFIIFGLAFWPQDFYLFVLATIAIIVFIILFTAVFGRVWCGWACPQTVFMEMVFRKIEYWIEGDASKQRALNNAPMSGEKFFKKATKHAIFFSIAFLIGNTFMAYIVGIDALADIVSHPPAAHLTGFVAVVFFSLVFYWVFAYFREQACVLVCPYGRLQSVLLDKNSIVVSYDFKRGEPRGKISKKQPQQLPGDCIDCHLCVDVCPTGIDIRNGTQLECVNCTACIDACDDVMRKVSRPTGLIRYASYNGIEQGAKLVLTPRIMAYSALLFVLVAALFVLLLSRSDVETTILRTPGVLFQENADGTIGNLYSIRVVNKTFEEMPIQLRLKQKNGHIRLVGSDQLIVPKDGIAESAFFVDIPRDKLFSANSMIAIEVFSGEHLLETVNTTFMGPSPKK